MLPILMLPILMPVELTAAAEEVVAADPIAMAILEVIL
jgi:hypothetical protein